MSRFTVTRLLYTFQTRKRSPQKFVVTLDPSKFAEQKQHRLHIGNLKCFQPHVVLHNQSTPVAPNLNDVHYDRSQCHKIPVSPYPPDTTAFIYYFTPPEKPRIAGELRLRVASNDDFASFERGSDLLKLNGQPWSRSLCRVSKYYIPLYEKLREDGLVPDDLDAVLSTFPPVKPTSQPLYTLSDTFILDFSKKRLKFTVITEQGVEVIQFGGAFFERRPEKRSPYAGAYTKHHLTINDSNYSVGSALVRLERSTLPDHKGTRTVVLRILKIITSVECVIPHYDFFIAPPKEGELHRKCNKYSYKSNPPVWGIDIDKSTMLRGLRLLWDT